jgi:serine/threonine-protein kinase
MEVALLDGLIEALRDTYLLRPEQKVQLDDIALKFAEPQEFAEHLIFRGWLTRYQAQKFIEGRGRELMLGSYVILDKIGEGGMGTVYKANQVRLGRVVALKVISTELLENPIALKRFQREAKAAAPLNHPNIVRLYDADQADDRHFLVMEFVEGMDLSNRVRERGRLPADIACSYIRQAALGLQHAHYLGIVHRDIKPENLLVTTASSATPGGIVKILDMGLARATPGSESDSGLTALTQDGTVIGTPDYMSPEQGRNSSTVDGRSDLYSLGCTFYFLLAGQPPFTQGGALEKLMSHQMDSPPHIQLRRPDVPDEVAAILHALLAKRPEERFQSAAALADALAPWCTADSAPRQTDSTPDVGNTATRSPAPFERAASKNDPTEKANPPERAEADATRIIRKTAVVPPRRSRRRLFIWMGLVAASVGLIAGGIIVAANSRKNPSEPPVGHETEKQKNHTQAKKDKDKETLPLPPIRKNEEEPLDAFLPADTEIIAVLDVRELVKSKFFADKIKPSFEAEITALASAASFDPCKSIRRIIIAVGSDGNQPVVIVQGADFITSDLINWVSTLHGVQVSSVRVPGNGMKEVYRFVSEKSGAELYGAILSINPSSVVLSASRERVIDALACVGRKSETRFDDPTIRPMLARYREKPTGSSIAAPPVLWFALGTRGKRLGFENAMESGLQSITGLVRLGDALDFSVTIEANNRMEAFAAWSKVVQFARGAALKYPTDKRLDHLAALISQATPDKLSSSQSTSTFAGQWSGRIEVDQLRDWLAPLIARP